MKNNPKDAQKTWDDVYNMPEGDIPWYRGEEPEKWFTDIIQRHSAGRNNALDIGCGTGVYSNYVSKLGIKVLGIDFSGKAIGIAKKKYANSKNLQFLTGSIFKIEKITNGKFDLVFAISVLHTIPNNEWRDFANKVTESMTKGGILVMLNFTLNDPRFNNQREYYFPPTKTTTYPMSKEDLTELFSKDFNILEMREEEIGDKFKSLRWVTVMEKK